MDARIRSSLSRRKVVRAGLLAYLGAGCARICLGEAPGPALPLITKAIPSTGERLPAIGLGSDSFRSAEIPGIRAEIQRMSEIGGSVIDTAAAYGDSEAIIGDALAALGLRDRLFLATKLTPGGWLVGGGSDGVGGEASLQRSLQRLKTTRLDLLQVHNLDGVDSLMPMLQAWKKAGKIRYIGVTTSRVAQHGQLVEAMRKYRLDFIQVD